MIVLNLLSHKILGGNQLNYLRVNWSIKIALETGHPHVTVRHSLVQDGGVFYLSGSYIRAN